MKTIWALWINTSYQVFLNNPQQQLDWTALHLEKIEANTFQVVAVCGILLHDDYNNAKYIGSHYVKLLYDW